MLNTGKKVIVIFVALGLFGFYTASILSMDHNTQSAMDSCTMLMSGGMNRQNADACVSYHIGLFHNLSEITSRTPGMSLLVLLLAVLKVALCGTLWQLLAVFANRLWTRYRLFLPHLKEIFFIQLGFWLTLFEKRDPARASAMA